MLAPHPMLRDRSEELLREPPSAAPVAVEALLREQAELLDRSLALNQELARFWAPATVEGSPRASTGGGAPDPWWTKRAEGPTRPAAPWKFSPRESGLARPLLSPRALMDSFRAPLLADAAHDAPAQPPEPPPKTPEAEPAYQSEPAYNSGRSRRTSVDGLFPRTLDCKDRIHRLLSPQSYDIEDEYDQRSIWARLVMNHTWQHATQTAIIANVLWIGVDIDYNHAAKLADALPIFRIAANIFTLFFATEILARFLAFAQPGAAFRHGAFLFDLVLALLMVWETWLLELLPIPKHYFSPGKSSQLFRILRLLRLLRALRTTRAIRNFPEVMVLVFGAAQATRSVLCVLLLQTFLVYFFAIVFTSSISEEPAAVGKFETVPQSMYFLFKQLLIGFDAGTLDDLTELSVVYCAAFMFFLFVGQLTLMNMLTGILCDVASRVREDEQSAAFDKAVTDEVQRITKIVDSDNSGCIQREEFDLIIGDDWLLLQLHEIGVDIYGCIEFLTSIFQDLPDDQGLTYDEFTHVIHSFCGFKPATVKDLHRALKHIGQETSNISKLMEARTAPLHK